MKSIYCDIIEFEKEHSIQNVYVQNLDEDELEQCDKEIDIIVNDSKLSLDNRLNYIQSPGRKGSLSLTHTHPLYVTTV